MFGGKWLHTKFTKNHWRVHTKWVFWRKQKREQFILSKTEESCPAAHHRAGIESKLCDRTGWIGEDLGQRKHWVMSKGTQTWQIWRKKQVQVSYNKCMFLEKPQVLKNHFQNHGQITFTNNPSKIPAQSDSWAFAPSIISKFFSPKS